jgi:hypothetical protein
MGKKGSGMDFIPMANHIAKNSIETTALFRCFYEVGTAGDMYTITW